MAASLSLSLSLSASTRTCSPFIRVREVGRAAGHIIKLMRAVGSDFIHRRRRAAAETATPSKATAGATHNRFAVVVPRRFRRSDAAPITDCCGGIRRRPRPGRERERERERERATAMTCLASRGRLRTEAASKLARADLPALDTPTHRHTHTHTHTHTHIYIHSPTPCVCVCVGHVCVERGHTSGVDYSVAWERPRPASGHVARHCTSSADGRPAGIRIVCGPRVPPTAADIRPDGQPSVKTV